ncbi:MAG: hypothetical protein MHM6MM_003101, partial [Cercozoa sp. M6MM]
MTPEEQQDLGKYRTRLVAIVRAHGAGNYKKAMREAESLLEKFPKNGEVLALKGLVLASRGGPGSDDEVEGYRLVDEALTYNDSSDVIWHVQAMRLRAQGLLKEAVAAYKKSVAVNGENADVIRDLGYSQLQLRDFKGFLEQRRRLLALNADVKSNWIALAVAHFADKKYADAERVILDFLSQRDAEQKNLRAQSTTAASGRRSRAKKMAAQRARMAAVVAAARQHDTQRSEVVVFRLTCVAHQRDWTRLLKLCDEFAEQVHDVPALRRLRLQGLIALKRWPAARAVCLDILRENGEDVAALRVLVAIARQDAKHALEFLMGEGPSAHLTSRPNGMQVSCAAELRDFDYADVAPVLAEVEAVNPHAKAPKRFALDARFKDDEMPLFESMLEEYLTPRVIKGVPSLFTDVLSFYLAGETSKQAAVLRVAEKLRSQQHESPLTQVWVSLLLSQHFCATGDFDRAHQEVDSALEALPTCIELRMHKSRIFKKQGQFVEAYEAMEQARQMDEQDRYVNTKCVRAALRANMPERALELRQGHTRLAPARNETTGAEAAAALRCVRISLACFHRFWENQLTLYGYGARMHTVSSWLSVMTAGDRLRQHRFFLRGAAVACRLFLHLSRQEVPLLLSQVSQEEGVPKEYSVSVDFGEEDGQFRLVSETADATEKRMSHD